jgi:hypothetical protein
LESDLDGSMEMKSKEYTCVKPGCVYARDEYFQDSENIPTILADEKCPECGGILALGSNLKSNEQRWRHNDTNYG